MNPDKSAKEGIIQHLKYLSKRYEELLTRFDEMEDPIEQQMAHSHSWTAFFKKRYKKLTNNTLK